MKLSLIACTTALSLLTSADAAAIPRQYTALNSTTNASNSTRASVNSTVVMNLEWDLQCTPDLLPLKRTFDLRAYPQAQRLVDTVKQVEAYAAQHDYGNALLQWYNIKSNYSANNSEILAELFADLNAMSAQTAEKQGLKCLLTALQSSPVTSPQEQAVINALNGKILGWKAFEMSGGEFTKRDNVQCGRTIDQATLNDCQVAISQINSLKLTPENEAMQYQFNYGSCFLVIDTRYAKPSTVDMLNAATSLVTQCSDTQKVSGFATTSFGRLCLSDRATAC